MSLTRPALNELVVLRKLVSAGAGDGEGTCPVSTGALITGCIAGPNVPQLSHNGATLESQFIICPAGALQVLQASPLHQDRSFDRMGLFLKG
ncbi:MAG: hypothetical protein ACKVHR_13265 [Pirellulales bacterium]|jgi:hypothetical protein